MNKRGIATAILLTGMMALSGCGSSSSASPTPTPTETRPPADGGTFGTVAELKDAFVEAGGACPEFNQTNRVKLAAESAECSSTAVLSTYLSSSDISQLIQNKKELTEQLDSSVKTNSWLVGQNWVINSPETTELREKLGGKVVSF